MVVNGTSEFVGSDERAARRAIEAAAREPKALVRVLPDAGPSVRVNVAGAAAGAEILLAIVEDCVSSDVLRGENAGKHLAHTAVARTLVAAGRVDAAGGFDGTVAVSPGTRARHVFAFAQERGTGRVLGTSAPLRLPPAP